MKQKIEEVHHLECIYIYGPQWDRISILKTEILVMLIYKLSKLIHSMGHLVSLSNIQHHSKSSILGSSMLG